MPADLSPAAAAVDKCRRELEQRLEELSKAPVYLKAHQARYVAASVFELFEAQDRFNRLVIATLDELQAAHG